MDLLSCWCPYPNHNIPPQKSVSYQANCRWLQRAAEGDVGFLFMRVKYIKDLCFVFLAACWKSLSILGTSWLTQCSGNGDRERLGDATMETEDSPQTRVPARVWWRAVGMDFNQGKVENEVLGRKSHEFCGRPQSCPYMCLAFHKWAERLSKGHKCYCSPVGRVLAIK